MKHILQQTTGHLHPPSEPLPLDTMMAVQLVDLFRDGDHDIDRIVEFISQNPVLAAETLRRCNNAVFHRSEQTTDLFEAVTRLGYYELYDIVTASLTAQARQSRTIGVAMDQEFWDAADDLPPPSN